MNYDHTQRGYWHWLLYVVGLATGVGGWFLREHPPAPFILMGVGAIMVVLAMSFHYLRVRDVGDHLQVRFGPLPLLGTSIAYSSITDAQPGRSTFIDGWGIHGVPGRGWTYNIWGFACVVLTVDGKTMRIGTDDVDNLLEFLRSRIAA